MGRPPQPDRGERGSGGRAPSVRPTIRGELKGFLLLYAAFAVLAAVLAATCVRVQDRAGAAEIPGARR